MDNNFNRLIRSIKDRKWDKSFWFIFYFIFALGLGIFHLYTSAFGILESWLQRAVHLGFVLVVATTLPFVRKAGGKTKSDEEIVLECEDRKSKEKSFADMLKTVMDYILLALSLTFFAYILFNYPEILYRVSKPNPYDIIMCWLLVALLLVLTQKYLGWPLTIIACCFILYTFVGPYLPSAIRHGGFTIKKIVDQLFLMGTGIFGPSLGASAVFIALFIIFGNFLIQTKVGEFFITLATAVAGKYRGGPAKTAVVASALMGTIHGSGPGNVVTTGSFTIPMMKKLGYEPHFAAAVEAAASSGGFIMPPVMGATAFVMAEMTGIPYTRIIVAAAIPAILYFTAVFFMIHLEALKKDLKPMAKEDMPQNLMKFLLSEGYMLLPIAAIIAFLIMGYSPMKAGLNAILISVALSMFKKKTRLNLSRFITCIEGGAKEIVTVGLACGVAGIISALVSLTGLGAKLAYLITNVAHGNLLIALFLAMLVCIILGMGVPTTPAFIFVYVTTSTTLVNMGVSLLASSLFILFFAVQSGLTPPVCIVSFTAAGVAGADMNKTGWSALKLALSSFIVPFMFVFGPELLFEGPLPYIVWGAFTALFGVLVLSVSVHGWHMKGSCSVEGRIVLFAAALLLIYPNIPTDFIGFGLSFAVFIWEKIRMKRNLNTVVS